MTAMLVYVTVPSREEARKIAGAVVGERLAACANIHGEMTSLYWWDGKIQRDGETLMIMKTPARNVKKLLKRVKQLHSYSVPEFLTLAPLEGNPDYLNWVLRETALTTKARRH